MGENEIGVYGASDGLIEVVGDVQEEIGANFNEPTHLLIGNTQVVAEYDGEWHFEVVDKGRDDGVAWYSVGRKKVIEQANDYTEALAINTDSDTVKKVE